MKKFYHRLKKHFTHHAHKAIKQKASPHFIALGFAVGSFVAIFPTFFLGLLIILGLMIFYKKMSKLAAIAGLAFWNFVMMVPVYYLSYNLGKLIYPNINQTTIITQGSDFFKIIISDPFSFDNILNFIKENIIFIKQYFIGNLFISIIFSILSYFIIKRLVILYQITKEKRKLKKLRKK